ncbi:putative glycerol-3-phosphate acyltransferase 4, partial [Apostichopus japonicus]
FGRQRVEIACKDHGLQSNLQPQQGESLPISQVSLIQKDSPRHFADVFKTKGNGEVEGDKSNSPQEFDLSHVCYLCKKGVEAIIDDDVTKCFSAEELGSWNLLTRTSMRYQYLSIRLTVLWSLGFLFRYFVLLPVRTFTLVVAIGYMIMSASFLGYLPESKFKAGLSRYCLLTVYTLASRAFSASLTFHNLENRAKGGGICVANHTTPVDVIFLSSDNCYAYIGQKHTGFVGFIERLMSRSGSDHIWFDRSEMRDRQKVTNRLKAHVEDATKFPMLIFPEGTCINNTSVMMFKKAALKSGCDLPVAMKYDPRFCDPFWNSSQDSFVRYLIKIMTSWSVVCDIWYLPPEHQKEGKIVTPLCLTGSWRDGGGPNHEVKRWRRCSDIRQQSKGRDCKPRRPCGLTMGWTVEEDDRKKFVSRKGTGRIQQTTERRLANSSEGDVVVDGQNSCISLKTTTSKYEVIGADCLVSLVTEDHSNVIL